MTCDKCDRVQSEIQYCPECKAKPTPDTPPWGNGQWCKCGMPHETGGPCWECRRA